MECGKCSSKQAAIVSNSSSVYSSVYAITFLTLGHALVSVPVLSNTIVVASFISSINFPPFIAILHSLACFIVVKTVIGIASLRAQEKSTISTDMVLVIFLVNR